MSLFSIKKKVKNFGDAMDYMRGVIRDMNLGHKKGDGWVISDDDSEVEIIPEVVLKGMTIEKNPVLESLTGELQALCFSEDISDEQLREASEGLLPSLCDALKDVGYGLEKPETDVLGGSEGTDDTKVVDGVPSVPEATKPKKEGFLPWNRKGR